MRSNPGCPGPCGDIGRYLVQWRHFNVREPSSMNERIRFRNALRGFTGLSLRQFCTAIERELARHFQYDADMNFPPPQCLGFITQNFLPRGWELEFDQIEDDGLGQAHYYLDLVPVRRNLYIR